MPKVSVVIPVFNGERFIKDAIDSVLAQTFKDLEVIVADDGSTDGTQGVVQGIAGKVIYKRQANAGPVAARNLGVAHSSGEYVAFLDHDDLWYPDKLEKQVAILDRHADIGLTCSEVDNINEEGHSLAKKTWAERRGIRSELVGDLHALLNRKFPVTVPSTWLVRKSLVDQVGRFDATVPFGGYGELEFCARIAEHSRIYFTPESLVQYRVREGGITKQKEAEMYGNYILVLDSLWRRWQDRPDRRALLMKLYGRNWFKKGRESLEQGDFDSARRFLIAAVRIRPFYIRPWLALLRLLLQGCLRQPKS